MTIRGFGTEYLGTKIDILDADYDQLFGQTADTYYEVDTSVGINHDRMTFEESYSFDAVTDSFGDGTLTVFESDSYYDALVGGYIDADTFTFAGGSGGSVNIDARVSTPDGDITIANVDAYAPDSEFTGINYEGKINKLWINYNYDGGANFDIQGTAEFTEEPEPSANVDVDSITTTETPL